MRSMLRASAGALGLSILLCLSAPAQTARIDVSGEWELVVQTRHGEMTSTVRFVQDGPALRVSMAEPRGGDITGEGTLKGSEIQWAIVRQTAQGGLKIVYSGTVEGASMSGQAQIGGRGSVPWKAVRK